MLDKPKRWQTRIWIGEMYDKPIAVYGDSLAALREAAGEWLIENKPIRIGNAPPNYELSKRVNYLYSDETTIPRSEWDRREPRVGWYYVKGSEYRSPEYIGDINQTAAHFVENALIIEKGPDYTEVSLYEKGELELSRVKTVLRAEEALEVNDLLQRGWQIIALEYKGQRVSSYRGDEEIVERRAVFVLGHPEENAI